MAAKKGKKGAAKSPPPKKKGKGSGSGGDYKGVSARASEVKRYTQRLPVPVGADVARAAAAQMATVHFAREQLKEERRNAMANFREKMNGLDQRMGELAETARNSTELQDIECVDMLEPNNEVLSVRLDTKTIFDRRQPTAEDLQTVLPGTDAPPKSGAAAKKDAPPPASSPAADAAAEPEADDEDESDEPEEGGDAEDDT